MELKIRGTIQSGQETLDTAIRDLEYVAGPKGPVLISVSGPEGGLASYSLHGGALPRIQDREYFVSPYVSGVGPALVVSHSDNGIRVHVTGIRTDGLISYSLYGQGDFAARTTIDGAGFGTAPAVAVETASGRIVLADPGQPGFSVHGVSDDLTLVNGRTVPDTDETYAGMVGAMATARVRDSDFVIVTSQTESGVTVYNVDSARPQAGDSVGPPDGLGLMVPTDVGIVKTGGAHYLIVASSAAQGQSGALSVMRVDANGRLTPTDHVLDTRDSRFGNTQKIAAVSAEGHVYVVAGGGDYGITLFELLPNGQLVHVDSVPGTIAARLDNVTALEAVVVGGELQIFVAAEGGGGIVTLSADISARGDTVIAGRGGDEITGGGGNDILVDGGGVDTLSGGGGADRYVLSGDGREDRIVGFDPSEDTLDLTGIRFLYDVNGLAIQSIPTGARVTYREETIVIGSAGGGTLDPEDVRAAVDLAIDRSFVPPQAAPLDRIVHGDAGSDSLSGGEGADRLYGRGGGDELEGGGRNDRMFGGSGSDTLHGQDGDDILYGQTGDDRLYGGAGGDELHAGGGDDLLDGGEGDDHVFGGIRVETVYGRNGANKLYWRGDADRLYGHGRDASLHRADGDDTLYGREGADWLDGGDDDDRIFGGEGGDTLYGREGADTLNGGPGDDVLKGGIGADVFVFRAGDDADVVLDFDPGEDMLSLDAGWLDDGAGGQAFVEAQAHETAQGAALRFDGGDTILLQGFTDMDALGDTFVFV